MASSSASPKWATGAAPGSRSHCTWTHNSVPGDLQTKHAAPWPPRHRDMNTQHLCPCRRSRALVLACPHTHDPKYFVVTHTSAVPLQDEDTSYTRSDPT